MKYFFIFLFTFSSLFSLDSTLDGRIIESIEVVADHGNIDKQSILDRLGSREGDIFSQSSFDVDLKALSIDFDRVEPRVEQVGDKVFIVIKIWEKPVIRSITWEGTEQIGKNTLEKKLGFKVGQVYDRNGFMKALGEIKAHYLKKGFFQMEIHSDMEMDPVTSEVDLKLVIHEGTAGRIKEVIFEGVDSEEQKEIRGLLLSKKFSPLTSWLNGQGTYNPEMAEQDELIVLNYMQSLGYADAKVESEIQDAEEKRRVYLKFSIHKGALHTVGALEFEGNILFSDETIESHIPLESGDPYSPEKMREMISELTDLYGRRGHIEAIVSHEPIPREDEDIFDIYIHIEEGLNYKVGLIKVIGNDWTDTPVVLHETLLTPGETFNYDKLKKTEERLLNIGYFENVNVYAVKSKETDALGANYRDVHVEVEEKGTGSFGFSLGFSSLENFFGTVNITESNFRISGLPSLFSEGYRAVRGGGEYAHLELAAGQKHSNYTLSWTKPYFMDSNWTVGFEIDHTNNQAQSNDYDIRSYSVTVHGKYFLNQFMRFGTYYRVKHSDIVVEDSASSKLKEEAAHDGLISAVGGSFAYDSSNHPMKPTEGFRSVLKGEFAGLGGGHHFVSMQYLNTYYCHLHRTGVVRIRFDQRLLYPLGNSTASNIPLDERYYLGGENSVRGYRPFSIGPRFAGTDDPKGGISSMLGTLEYNRMFTSNFDAYIFADVGNVSASRFDWSHMRASLGYGVRINLIPGAPPVILGVGYPLNPAMKKDVQHFFFTFGGRF